MYQSEILDSDPVQVTSLFWKSIDSAPSREVSEFAEQLFTSAFSRKSEHDRTVTMFLKDNWPFERLGAMEKCVLRVTGDALLHSVTPSYAVSVFCITLS